MSNKKYSCKDKVEIIQAIVTIAAIFLGGLWTYNLFIKERKGYPHANLKHIVSHTALSYDINLLKIAIELTNTGSSKLVVKKSIIRVQQILPILPCVSDYPCALTQVNNALKFPERDEDRFSWPLIAKRERTLDKPFFIEPNEKDEIDFEFVIPSDVTHVRIYSYFRNEEIKLEEVEVGWSQSIYYEFK